MPTCKSLAANVVPVVGLWRDYAKNGEKVVTLKKECTNNHAHQAHAGNRPNSFHPVRRHRRCSSPRTYHCSTLGT